MKKTLFFLSLIVCSFFGVALAVDDLKVTFLLPIDWTSNNTSNLSVNVPEGFKPIQSMNAIETGVIEFIPENETAYNWSEIITIHKFVGSCIPADKYANFIKESIFKAAKVTKSWKIEKSINKSTVGSFGLDYSYNGNSEVIGALYFSGPYDCCGVQYTIKASSKMNALEARNKIIDFYNNNVKTFNSPKY